jgi:hypothetical protein
VYTLYTKTEQKKTMNNRVTFLHSATVTNSSSNRSVFGVSQLQVIVHKLITENLSWLIYKQRIVYVSTGVISTAGGGACVCLGGGGW